MGKHKVTITVEIEDEDLVAGEWDLSHGYCPPMTPQDLVDYHLERAVRFRLHLLRSKMKWAKLKLFDSPKLRREQGYRMNTVTDKHGNEHHVMLPADYERPVQVIRPVEGSWECPESPTKTCWYCDQEDPAWDFCLFCGDPHERK